MLFNLRGLICGATFCALLLWAAPSTAQVTTAEIIGTVTDPSGAILPNVQVTIKNLGTGITRSMATTATGSYTFTLLPIGSYSVTVEASGFKTFTVPTLTLAAGDRARVDAKLEIGNITDTVEVSAESAGALQTDSATVGGLVTSKAVQDLPLSGRNFMMLVQLVPGGNEGSENSLAGGTRPDDRRQTSAVSVNGMGDSVNNYLVDGLDNNERLVGTIGVKPSIDALAEVKVQTNLYSAEVGRTAGAVINMLTKSGTNEFHGTAFEFLRNDVFSAKDFFNVPQAGNPLAGVKPKYRQNQFGGSIGGPIIKNKMFFFGDYEGLRIVQGKTGTAFIGTACMLGRATCNGVQQLGNFSELLPSTIIYDVTKNPITPFPNNIIPPDRISPISKNYAAMMPTVTGPTCTSAICNYIGNPSKTQTADTFDVRIDNQLGKNDMLYGRYSFNNTKSFVPGLLPPVDVAGVTVGPGGVAGQVLYPGNTDQRQQQLGVGYTHTFSPTLLLQANFGLLRSRTETLPLNWGVDVNKAFGGPDVNISEETSGLANIYFQDGGYGSPSGSSGGGLGDNMWLPLRYWDWVYQGNANLTWVRGAHSFKFGGNILRRSVDNFQSRWAKGQFTFSNRQTNSANGGAGGSGGNSFASFLLGYIYDQRRELQVETQRFRMMEYGAYVQDDWRATPWLTLNLGLRYDIYMPWTEADNNLSTFDPANSKMLDGGQVVVAGTEGFSKSFVDAEFGHFQPRAGFAASLGSGFVFRGGFGMSYYMTQANSPSTMKNQPFVSNMVARSILGPGNTPIIFGQAVGSPEASSTCLTAACGNKTVVSVPQAYALDHKDARVYQFNLTLEKEFAGNVMSIGYVGNKAQNMNRVISNGNLPEPPQTAGGCGVTTAITLPHPCQPYYSKIPLVQSITNLNRHDGKLNYNGLQAIFTRRFGQGLSATSSYTWGKSLSNTGTPAGGCSGCSLWPSQWETYDYGSSANDIRQRFAFTANYQLPFGQSLSGFAGQVAKGWQINGLFAYTTGQRLTVTNGRPQINNGVTSDRPNGLPQPENFNRTIEQWFDTTTFALQPYGTPGNLGRGTLQGPPQRRIDFSVFKDFPITEGVKLQFRVETFNLTNTPSFATPGTAISGWTSADIATARPTQAGNFGRVTSTSQFYTPRDVQFALKLVF